MPSPLDYASDSVTRNQPDRFEAPRSIVFASPIPVLIFITLLFTHHTWSRWIFIRIGWERAMGTMWIATAIFSVACIITLCCGRKRWDVWLCLLLHTAMVAFTVFPGCIAIPWLMHWMTGPGA